MPSGIQRTSRIFNQTCALPNSTININYQKQMITSINIDKSLIFLYISAVNALLLDDMTSLADMMSDSHFFDATRRIAQCAARFFHMTMFTHTVRRFQFIYTATIILFLCRKKLYFSTIASVEQNRRKQSKLQILGSLNLNLAFKSLSQAAIRLGQLIGALTSVDGYSDYVEPRIQEQSEDFNDAHEPRQSPVVNK
uniref:Uncharacterized protein n=1 Tax=Romanomermis culicivorax TaxID=13658 RepID=A0A915L0M8_ROMCU